MYKKRNSLKFEDGIKGTLHIGEHFDCNKYFNCIKFKKDISMKISNYMV